MINPTHWRFRAFLLAIVTVLAMVAPPNGAHARDTSPLVEAVRGGDIAQVQRLLENGAEVDEAVTKQKTALYLAAAIGRHAIVEVLLENGAVVDKPNDTKETPLMAAAAKGHLRIVETLLANGADVNARDWSEYTALIGAAEKGHIGIIDTLLAHGAEVNAPEGLESVTGSALAVAAGNGHIKIVRVLLANGADVNAQGSFNGTALIFAAARGHVKIVEMLMANGADVNAPSHEGFTALMGAASGGNGEIFEMLLANGADMTAQANNGRTLLMLAAQNGSKAMVKDLLARGEDVNAQDDSGTTALHFPAFSGNSAIVEILLQNGADLHARTDEGYTALIVTAMGGHIGFPDEDGHVATVEVLLAAGADVSAQTKDGNNALMYASSSGREGIVATLLAHGADGATALNFAKTDKIKEMLQAAIDKYLNVTKIITFHNVRNIYLASNRFLSYPDHVVGLLRAVDKGLLYMDAFICDATRTPIGRYGGALSSVRTDDLAALPIAALMARNPGVDWASVDDVILGSANQAGEDNRNVARMAALLAGLPVEVPGSTINRLCASGMDAVGMAARGIRAGDYDMVIAGGVESMSRAPFVMPKAGAAFSRANAVYDTTIGWRFVNPKMKAKYGADSMPETADNVAADYGVSREDQDAFAVRSQARWDAAHKAGHFDDEITPVSIPQRKGDPVVVDTDEHPRPGTSADKLGTMRAINGPDLTVTAGNASGVNDGAAALLLASQAAAERNGLTPMARVVAMAAAGVEPRVMGIGPVPAMRKVLARSGLTIEQMDVIELNEAFAAQGLASLRELGVADDAPHVNPQGGAIALGHPLGMSGARLVMTAAYQLRRARGQYAMCTMCVGVGQGVALILERV